MKVLKNGITLLFKMGIHLKTAAHNTFKHVNRKLRVESHLEHSGKRLLGRGQLNITNSNIINKHAKRVIRNKVKNT